MLSSVNNRQVSFHESIATAFTKIHPKINVIFFVGSPVVIKYSTDASPLVMTMFVHKVIITVFLEFWIEKRIEVVTNILIGLMEMCAVLFKQVVRCQVGSSAEPPVCQPI